MKKKMKSKLIAAVMSLAMAFTMIPVIGAPVYADDPAPPAPGIAQGPDVLSIGTNTSGAATVHMADKTWRVIGYKGEGVASTQEDPEKPGSTDTMTLIAADNLKTDVKFGRFHDLYPNHYESSILRTEVEPVQYTFYERERAWIARRDFAHGDHAGNPDGIAGDGVKGAVLWPLSTQEARQMDTELRKAGSYWWLRSPAFDPQYAMAVKGEDGSIYHDGYGVDCDLSLRPAFNFNLSPVIFTSAAVGGKSSGDVGAGSLKSVDPNSSNEWKLTLESGHDNFEVENVSTCDGKTVDIKYSGAVAANGEYISAIVTDENGAVKYYGNLIEFADGDSTEGTAQVTIDRKMEPTDKLYIFNEQLNGDKKTDYSSALNEVPTPPAGHDWCFEGFLWKGDRENGYTSAKANYECRKNDDHIKNIVATVTEVTTPPTCTEAGKTTYTATIPAENSLDGIEHQDSMDAKATEAKGHTWDAGEVTKPATTTETGVRTFTCETCKATKIEDIPKLDKKANPLKVKGRATTVKFSKLKKKAQNISRTKAITVSGAQGALAYKKVSVTYTKAKSVKMSKKALKKYNKKVAKKITINAKTGDVTVKKGLKKGTYKVKVKVMAAGNADYNPSAWKTVTFKIKIK